jgi:hypothetical protein
VKVEVETTAALVQLSILSPDLHRVHFLTADCPEKTPIHENSGDPKPLTKRRSRVIEPLGAKYFSLIVGVFGI